MPQYDRVYIPENPVASRVAWKVPGAGNAPTPATYEEVYRWNVDGGSSNFQSRNADYYSQGTGTGILDGALYANDYGVNTGQTQISLSGLLNDGNTYRLRLVGHTSGGANALPSGKSGVVTGQITTLNQNPFGNTSRQAFIVNSASAMRTAFGDPTNGSIGISAGGGFWVLERQTSAGSPGTAENDYRLVGRPTPNAAPDAVGAPYTLFDAVTPAWSGTQTYAANFVVVRTVLGVERAFRARNSINAPSITYTEHARWNHGPCAVQGQADFNGTNGSFCSDGIPASGTAAPASNQTGTWRLRRIGNGTITDAEIVGSYNFQLIAFGDAVIFYITSTSAMQAAFGNAATHNDPTYNGVVWVLERQTTGTPNTAPESDSTNWEEVSVSNWNSISDYALNSLVRYNNLLYQNNQVITTAKVLGWYRRTALIAGDIVHKVWDTDATSGQEAKTRTIQ